MGGGTTPRQLQQQAFSCGMVNCVHVEKALVRVSDLAHWPKSERAELENINTTFSLNNTYYNCRCIQATTQSNPKSDI